MPYNKTLFPNPFFEEDDITLQSQTEHFKMFFNTHCNPYVQFFVCSSLVPMCPEQFPQAVMSCRSVCEEVKRDCSSILKKIGLEWPERFNCSKYKLDSSKMCMNPPLQTSLNLLNKVTTSKKTLNQVHKTFSRCPVDFIDLNPKDLFGKCVLQCEKSIMFTKDKKEQIKFWILIGSIVNALVTFLTSFIFLANRQRFSFPERSILHMAICYFCYSLPYFLRFILSFENLACSQLHTGQKYLIQSTNQENTICIISFFFVYFFSTAGALWWLVLTLTWYLSAAKKWVEEEIEKRLPYLNFFTWGISFVLTFTVLATNKVDASELTGICSVGNLNSWSLFWFVNFPKIILLFFGFFFLITGFSSIYKERKCFKQKGTDTSKLNKFMLKMGLFCALYLTFMIISILCNFYQIFILFKWQSATINCKINNANYIKLCTRPERPNTKYFVVNIIVNFLMGVATGLWIISVKTWKNCQNLICYACNNENKQKSLYTNIKTQYNPALTSSNCNLHRFSLNACQSNSQQQSTQQFSLTCPLLSQQQQQLNYDQLVENNLVYNNLSVNNTNLPQNLTNLMPATLALNSNYNYCSGYNNCVVQSNTFSNLTQSNLSKKNLHYTVPKKPIQAVNQI